MAAKLRAIKLLKSSNHSKLKPCDGQFFILKDCGD